MAKNNSNEISLKDIKLIIWDLDDSFWRGTLSEGGATFVEQNVDFIKKTLDRGIMHSICSKNNFENVKKFFGYNYALDLFDMFIFKSINWEAKGQRVKDIIEKAQLRNKNVLFIDDNTLNLEEVRFFCKDILCACPGVVKDLYNQIDSLEKKDKARTRLQQYKVLEKKCKDKEKISSNEHFLKQSKIVVTIAHNCLSEIARIHELILRTNQLNFTKKRISKEELETLLNDNGIETGYVKVYDKYGDYGIVGFYALNRSTNELLHFLFSCRTLNMGIEQYVYSQLNFPSLKIEGEVVGQLKENMYISWIKNEHRAKKQEKVRKWHKTVLFKGPCDLSSVLPYIQNSKKIATEFYTPDLIAYEHTCCIADSKRLPEEKLSKFLQKIPFYSPKHYQTDIFNKKYKLIVLSIVLDGIAGLYKDKESGIVFPLYDFCTPLTDKKNRDFILKNDIWGCKITEKDLDIFSRSFDFVGQIKPEESLKNVQYIYSQLDENTKFVIVSGSEKPTQKVLPNTKGLDAFYKKVNALIMEWSKDKRNVVLVNTTHFIQDDNDYVDSIVHYSRRVYFDLAQEISRYLPMSNLDKFLKPLLKLCSYLTSLMKGKT